MLTQLPLSFLILYSTQYIDPKYSINCCNWIVGLKKKTKGGLEEYRCEIELL